MGLIKTLAIVGGAGLVVNELTKSKDGQRSANTTTPTNVIDSQRVKELILSDPMALNLIRGEKGDTGNGYKALSSSNVAIAVGAKTFTVAANLAYSVGARVRLTVSTDVTKFMEGVVTAYTGTTLTVQVDAVSGTGTFAGWNLNLAGDKGVAGQAGAAGHVITNYDSSLLVNGAGELGNTNRWSTPNGSIVLGEVHEGMASIEITTGGPVFCPNETTFHLEPRGLYKLTCSAKTTSTSYRFMLRRYDALGAEIAQNSNTVATALGSPTFNNAAFARQTLYYGGVDTNILASIGLNTVKCRLEILTGGVGVTKINRLSFQRVSLGEPVPYNLAYLPTFQTVYDPTTGKLGMFNGTTVVWSA